MWKRLRILSALATALTLAGCAQVPDSAPVGEDGKTQINVGTVSIASSIPLVVAEERGLFDKHGLDVNIDAGQNFGSVLPRIQNGELHVGFAASVPLLNASANGAPLSIFSVANHTDVDTRTANTAVMTMPGSGLENPRDLEGHKVGIAANGNTDDLAIRAAVANDGGDPSKVELLELGVGPPLLQGLVRGNVDAIIGGEPTFTLSKNAGGEVMFYPHVEGLGGLPLGAYFASESFADNNPEVLDDFNAALEEASEYARQNPDEVRRLLPDFLNVDAKTAQTMRLPAWNTTFSRSEWQELTDVGMEQGVVDDRVDLDVALKGAK